MAVGSSLGGLGEGEDAVDASRDPWLEYFANIYLIGKPEVTNLYFVRHAQATHNAGLEANPKADPPLTPLGIRQSELVARRLAQRGVEVIYCSPSRRARQTAEPLARLLGLAVVIVNDLREVRLRSFDPGAAGGSLERRRIGMALEADTRWDRFPGAEPRHIPRPLPTMATMTFASLGWGPMIGKCPRVAQIGPPQATSISASFKLGWRLSISPWMVR